MNAIYIQKLTKEEFEKLTKKEQEVYLAKLKAQEDRENKLINTTLWM